MDRILAFASLLALLASPLPAQIDVDRLQGLRARSIGPAGMSGRIADVEAVESDPDVIYVGAATGGVWKTTNGGHTWTPIFDDQRVNGIGAVAVFQANPDIVWVGTGEGNPRNSAGVGAGMWRSIDGGRSWSFLGLEASERIHRIVLHPSDPDVAWVAALGPGWSDGEERGVFRTTDGGATWERVLWVNPRTGASDLVMDPRNPDKLFAGTWEFRRWPWFFESGGEGSGLWVTHDGGDSWRRLTSEDGLPMGELGRIGLAIARGRPDVVYALVEASRSALIRSGDGGATWQTVNNEQGVNPRPFYYTDIYVDPTNELRLYNLHSRFQVSEDGGRSFETNRSDVHSDHHALWIDPADADHMILGTDGGVWISRDRGDNWAFVDNLPVGQFYHVSVDDAVPFNIYGGMQDNGSWRGPSDVWENGGIRNWHWQEVGFGDGFATLVDPADPRYGYSMSQGGGLRRFDLRDGTRKDIRPWAPDSVDLRFNWNAAIATDPFEAGTIYYGSQFVHRSRDRGDSWEILSPDLTTNDPEKQKQDESGGVTRDATGAENHTTILTIAPSPVERGVIWVGTDDGNVQLTRDGGATWTNVAEHIRGVPAATWVPHIEASKHAPGTAYVVFDDHRRGNWERYLYRTTDYGRSWTNIAEGSAIDGFLHVVEEDPADPRILWAGSEFGLWVSTDGGEGWARWSHGFPTAPVRALVVHPRDHDLVVATHGRALYVVDDVRPLRALTADPSLRDRGVHLFDPPPAYVRTTRAVDGYHFSGDAMFRGQPRPEGALLSFWVGVDEPVATIEVLDEGGRAVRGFDVAVEPGVNRTAWNLREDPLGDPQGGRRGFGPEVLPGRYTVRVSAGDAASEASLEVRPDPRVDIPMDERRAKRDAVARALELSALVSEAEARVEELNEAADRLIEILDGRDDPGAEELEDAARDLKRELREVADFRDVNRWRRGAFSLFSSRDAPTEAQRMDLARMEAAVDDVVRALNDFMATRVEEFRDRLRSSQVDLFPRPEPIGSGNRAGGGR